MVIKKTCLSGRWHAFLPVPRSSCTAGRPPPGPGPWRPGWVHGTSRLRSDPPSAWLSGSGFLDPWRTWRPAQQAGEGRAWGCPPPQWRPPWPFWQSGGRSTHSTPPAGQRRALGCFRGSRDRHLLHSQRTTPVYNHEKNEPISQGNQGSSEVTCSKDRPDSWPLELIYLRKCYYRCCYELKLMSKAWLDLSWRCWSSHTHLILPCVVYVCCPSDAQWVLPGLGHLQFLQVLCFSFSPHTAQCSHTVRVHTLFSVQCSHVVVKTGSKSILRSN